MYSEIHFKGPKVPGSESPRERKGLGAKGLGSELAGVQSGAALQGAGGTGGGFSPPPVGERFPPSGNFGIFRRGWPLAI